MNRRTIELEAIRRIHELYDGMNAKEAWIGILITAVKASHAREDALLELAKEIDGSVGGAIRAITESDIG